MTTRTLTPAIAALAAQITSITRRDATLMRAGSADPALMRTGSADPALETGRLVSAALGSFLGEPELLSEDQQRARPDCYCQHVLYVDPDGAFSIAALVWMPGQRTPIHDHISWCVVGVHAGAEEETLYRLVDNGFEPPHLVRSGHGVNAEGTTSFFAPPGDIHEVCNATGQTVISIHVYGADIATLGSSIRRRYDLPILGV